MKDTSSFHAAFIRFRFWADIISCNGSAWQSILVISTYGMARLFSPIPLFQSQFQRNEICSIIKEAFMTRGTRAQWQVPPYPAFVSCTLIKPIPYYHLFSLLISLTHYLHPFPSFKPISFSIISATSNPFPHHIYSSLFPSEPAKPISLTTLHAPYIHRRRPIPFSYP